MTGSTTTGGYGARNSSEGITLVDEKWAAGVRRRMNLSVAGRNDRARATGCIGKADPASVTDVGFNKVQRREENKKTRTAASPNPSCRFDVDAHDLRGRDGRNRFRQTGCSDRFEAVLAPSTSLSTLQTTA
jgi:hypothetical protein